MFRAIGQMFNALFILFSAAEKGAHILDKAADYGNEAIDGVISEARIERQKRLAQLQAQAQITQA